MQNKLTRKQFLLSMFSFIALIAVGNIPNMVKTIVATKKSSNGYGNHSYGGSKKNV
jgi:hypothetical protein